LERRDLTFEDARALRLGSPEEVSFALRPIKRFSEVLGYCVKERLKPSMH